MQHVPCNMVVLAGGRPQARQAGPEPEAQLQTYLLAATTPLQLSLQDSQQAAWLQQRLQWGGSLPAFCDTGSSSIELDDSSSPDSAYGCPDFGSAADLRVRSLQHIVYWHFLDKSESTLTASKAILHVCAYLHIAVRHEACMQVSRADLVLAAANGDLGVQQRAFQQLQDAGYMVPAVTADSFTGQLRAHMAALSCTAIPLPVLPGQGAGKGRLQVTNDLQLPRVLVLSAASSFRSAQHVQLAEKWFHCQSSGSNAPLVATAAQTAAGQPQIVLEAGFGLLHTKSIQAPKMGLPSGWQFALVGIAHGPHWESLGSLLQEWPDAVVIDSAEQQQQQHQQLLHQLKTLGVAVHVSTGSAGSHGCPPQLAHQLWHPAGHCKGQTQRRVSLQQAAHSADISNAVISSSTLHELQHTAQLAATALQQANMQWPLQQLFRAECSEQLQHPDVEAQGLEAVQRARSRRLELAASSTAKLPQSPCS